MVPVLFSTVSSPDSVSPRGRKRHNVDDSAEIERKRHSNSDLSDDDSSRKSSGSPNIDDDRRAHHNELERRRRDHIKDHFMSLKDAIPLLEGEKSSRALILKRAVEYISAMQSRLSDNQRDIEELKRRNEQLSAGLLEKNATETSPVPSAVPSPPVVATAQPTVVISAPSAPIVSAPTTSTFVDCSTPTLSTVSPNSSFTPVIPSAKLSPVHPVSNLSISNIAAILGIKTVEPSSQLPKDLLIPDLSRLLSLSTLAHKEQSLFPQLLF